MTLSILVRWPVVGLMLGSVTGDITAWRRDPAVVRLCSRLTWLLVAPCVIRVAVQLPLYLFADDGAQGRLAGRHEARARLAAAGRGAVADGAAARPRAHAGAGAGRHRRTRPPARGRSRPRGLGPTPLVRQEPPQLGGCSGASSCSSSGPMSVVATNSSSSPDSSGSSGLGTIGRPFADDRDQRGVGGPGHVADPGSRTSASPPAASSRPGRCWTAGT